MHLIEFTPPTEGFTLLNFEKIFGVGVQALKDGGPDRDRTDDL